MNRAVDLLRRGQRVKVTIGPGTYRERVTVNLDADDPASEPLLMIEGSSVEPSIISGSVKQGWEASTWQPVAGYPGVYAHEWTGGHTMYAGPWANNFGQVFEGTAARNESLWVGGRPLIAVSLDRYTWVDPDGPSGNIDGAGGVRDRNNQRGAFRYDGVDESGLAVLDRSWTFAVSNHPEAPEAFRNKVFIRIPADMRLEDVGPIEVAKPIGDHWFQGLITFRRKNNLIVRDLTVTHAGGSFLANTVGFFGTRNVLVERVNVVGNAVSGINFTPRTRRGEDPIRPSRITVRDTVVRDNGMSGLGGSLRDSLIERSDFSFNNWRGFAAGWSGWHYAGVKNGSTNRTTFRDCTFVGNQAIGLWFDVHCSEILYERCFAYANYGAGIFFELSGKNPEHGDDLARHCVSAYNNDLGYKISNMRRSTVVDCLAVNNRRHQMVLMNNQNEAGREPSSAAEYEFLRMEDNLIISQRPDGLAMGVANPQLDRGQELMKAYDGSRNRYLITDVGQPQFITAGYRRVDFSGWTNDLRDLGAVSAETGSTVEIVSPIGSDRLDFYRDQPNLLTEWCEARGVAIPWDLIERFRANPTWSDDRMEPFPTVDTR
ncbi:MAG: right-handed parallel beta-helix repeat-containing protein [Planctomycetota bacterium]